MSSDNEKKVEWGCDCTDTQTGGKRRMTKTEYRQYLDKKDVNTLRTMAKKRGLKISVKRDGKTKYVKKDTIINNLANQLFAK